MSLFIHFLFAKVILPYPPKGVSFKWSKQKFVCGKIMVKRKITAKLAVIFLKNGGPNRDRTDDLTDANRTLSQLSYRPIFGCFVYFCSICLCSLLFWPGPCYVALALPAELWAHIGHFPSKKVMKNRFLRYSVLRRNHGKPD